jgi:hypothetical protein
MTGTLFPGVEGARRRRRTRRLILVGALLAVLIAAGLLSPRATTGGLAVPTSTTAARAAGVFQGPLRAQRTGDRVCFSVATGNGTAFLVLPAGWSADRELDLLDTTGGVRVQRGGTALYVGTPLHRTAPAPCRGSGRTWAVQDVRTPSTRG